MLRRYFLYVLLFIIFYFIIRKFLYKRNRTKHTTSKPIWKARERSMQWDAEEVDFEIIEDADEPQKPKSNKNEKVSE